jgi:hypothetical protein
VISHTSSKGPRCGVGGPLKLTGSVASTSGRRSLITLLLVVGLLAVAYLAAAAVSASAEQIVVKNYVPAASSFKNGAALPLSPGGNPPSDTLGPACVPETNCARYMTVPLEFHGGSVIRAPQVYLIFWGSNWTHEYEGERWRGHILNTLGGLTEEYGFNLTYQHILSQYYDSTGPIEGVKIAGDYVYEGVTAPQGQEREDIKGQVESAITQNKWPRGANSLFIVLHPPGTAYQQGFAEEKNSGCGYHERDHQGDVFGFVPDLANKYFSAKCGPYAESENKPIYNRIVTMVASHEYAEAVTDPAEGGWFDNEGWEIGDICAEHGPILVNEVLGIWMNGLWGNNEAAKKGENEGCVVKDPPEPNPPAPTATTGAATKLETQSATLEGTVNPNGPDAHYYFEYGPTTSYGTKIPIPPGNDAGFGTKAVPVSVKITGLKAGTLYHYRLVASSWVGTTDGADRTFTTPGWVVQETTVGNSLFRGVSCASGNCTAVGFYHEAVKNGKTVPLAERSNGKTWEVQATPNPAGAEETYLEGVSCASATSCMAVGEYFTSTGVRIFSEQWNGKVWTLQGTPEPEKATVSELKGISCASTTSCIAVGYYATASENELPLYEQWNGKVWKVEQSVGGAKKGVLAGVSCTSASACTAVGGSSEGSLAERWNGKTWQVQTVPAPQGFLRAVSCPSASACTTVGYHSSSPNFQMLVEHWNGSTWETQAPAIPEGSELGALNGVSCSSTETCTAVGLSEGKNEAYGTETTVAERWSHNKWEIQQPAETTTGSSGGELFGISCPASTLCRAVGGFGNGRSLNHTLAEESLIPE